ncbi:MAG: cupin domain-containing protein [Candidatus Pacebacteria bacterium]|nr:cupin domain-containing protein [Candidatus Paceibacterota bacterium]
MKKGYHTNIEQSVQENASFRRVLYTGEQSQLVLMTLQPGQEIGLEMHTENDQFFRFESGQGRVIINETEYVVTDGHAIVIPRGATHNIINTSETDMLKMYTIYSPAHHKDGIIHETKEIASQDKEEFDGMTTE